MASRTQNRVDWSLLFHEHVVRIEKLRNCFFKLGRGKKATSSRQKCLSWKSSLLYIVEGLLAAAGGFGDRWQVTGDRWQVTGDRKHMTRETWHMMHYRKLFFEVAKLILGIDATLRRRQKIWCLSYTVFPQKFWLNTNNHVKLIFRIVVCHYYHKRESVK